MRDRWLPALSMAVALGSFGGGRAALAQQPAPAPKEADAAKKLTEALQGLTMVLGEGKPEEGLQKLSAAATSGAPWIVPYMKQLEPCTAHWADILAAAQQGNAAGLAAPSLSGHLVIDAVLESFFPRSKELTDSMFDALGATKPDVNEIQRIRQEMEIATAFRKYLIAQLDTLDLALEAPLKFGPPEERRTGFEAVATRLGEAKRTRGRLEGLLRDARDTETDPKARKAMEARMTQLGVALVVASPTPKATPAP